MFETDTNADGTISRRNALTIAGGVLAGSTVLAGLGAGPAGAETGDGLRIEVRELTGEYVAVEVWFPQDVFDDVEFPQDVFLGHAERFVIHEDGEWVSLPEDTGVLATPIEWDRLDEQTYLTYFHSGDVDLSEAEGDDVVLGLGGFPERTVPGDQWDACPGHRDY